MESKSREKFSRSYLEHATNPILEDRSHDHNTLVRVNLLKVSSREERRPIECNYMFSFNWPML